jgi:predicted nuclease of predicted toxin-antitoxin system
MKLLFDANLSPELVRLLDDTYPGSAHVLAVGLGASPSDEDIWAHAKASGFVVVSKDADFFRLSSVRGAPPKVVWLRIGNGATAVAEAVLRKASVRLENFAADDAVAILVLGGKSR